MDAWAEKAERAKAYLRDAPDPWPNDPTPDYGL